jgi:hypothetical protein
VVVVVVMMMMMMMMIWEPQPPGTLMACTGFALPIIAQTCFSHSCGYLQGKESPLLAV